MEVPFVVAAGPPSGRRVYRGDAMKIKDGFVLRQVAG